MKKQVVLSFLILIFALATGCTSTAKNWNYRVGPNAKPVYVKSQTQVGFNIAIFIPFIGATTLPKQIDKLTGQIQAENGDVVRLIQSSTENYWYGFPPFTWVLTPVITTVTADYEPSAEVL